MIRYKVINIFKSIDLTCSTFTKRCFSNNSDVGNRIQHLSNRGLVKVSGDEVIPFLQGLITNDMKHLEEKPGSMYTLFLNTKGRVLYDSIIYSTNDPKCYLVECDSSVVSQFQKHLKLFRVKRKIDIDPSDNKVWVVFNNNFVKHVTFNEVNCEALKGSLKSMVEVQNSEACSMYNDPRMNALGARILCRETLSCSDITKKLEIKDVKESKNDDYKKFRYCLGIGEGVNDLPQGACFPLEANADFLHGVSFHKGCYIGQELTARTYHTGVIRKRLMPLLFDKDIEGVAHDSPVFGSQNNKSSFGKVRGIFQDVGLGLLRVAQVSKEPHLDVSGNKAKTYIPPWWPEEAPKEKASVG